MTSNTEPLIDLKTNEAKIKSFLTRHNITINNIGYLTFESRFLTIVFSKDKRNKTHHKVSLFMEDEKYLIFKIINSDYLNVFKIPFNSIINIDDTIFPIGDYPNLLITYVDSGTKVTRILSLLIK